MPISTLAILPRRSARRMLPLPRRCVSKRVGRGMICRGGIRCCNPFFLSFSSITSIHPRVSLPSSVSPSIADHNNGNRYASAGAVGLLGLYAVFKENPDITPSGGGSSSSPRRISTNPDLDPGTDARGRTSPLSSVMQSRQHHDLPAHAPGGETIEFKLGRG